MLAAAERRPRDPQGEEGNVAKEFMNFFFFCVVCCVWGVDSFVVLFLYLIKKHSNYLVRTSEEESGYKKCCTRFVLEPRIGRSSSARTSAAAEGEQHRVQQQRAAAARFG